jgi:hypothetical protein
MKMLLQKCETESFRFKPSCGKCPSVMDQVDISLLSLVLQHTYKYVLLYINSVLLITASLIKGTN